jgi:hypothetical protein
MQCNVRADERVQYKGGTSACGTVVGNDQTTSPRARDNVLTIMSANHSHQRTANSVLCQDGDMHNITARRVSMSCRRWITFTRLCAPSARSGTHTSLSCLGGRRLFALKMNKLHNTTNDHLFMQACLLATLACLFACLRVANFSLRGRVRAHEEHAGWRGWHVAHNGRGRREPRATSSRLHK